MTRLVLLLALAGVAEARAQAVPDTLLRRELLEHVARDQAIRDTLAAAMRATGSFPEAIGRRMLALDSANTRWLKAVILQRGWPTRAHVGKEGTDAACLIVQHAVHDLDFMEQMVPILEKAHRAGDVEGSQVAMLADRVATHRGRRQRYGTDARVVDGRVIIEPIDDSAHVDQRRARLGLPPLAEYKRVLDSAYAKASP